jgi:hypothetical protein
MLRPAVALTLLCLLTVCVPAAAQTPDRLPRQAERLRVFIDDCGFGCFEDYLRDEITFVDFVRQAQDADVHLLSTSTDTGGGGRELVLRFVGRGRFAGHDEELRVVTLAGDTENMRRAQVRRTVEVGLLAFMAREGIPAGVAVSVEAERSEAEEPVEDPWNAWLFSIRTSADYQAEESAKDRSIDINLGADRITEAWKLTFGASLDYSTEEFNLDEDDPLKAVRKERDADWFIARSLGPHWSAGFDGRVESSTFGNTKFSYDMAPAIEYSVFPYEEYATRQLRLQYAVGVRHAEYNEITLYGKLGETHPVHEASITLDQRQPWGSLEARLEFSQYLHDPKFYRLEVSGDLSFRIIRGLSLTLEGRASRVRDQLSLPRRGATDEEVLLRLRELQSSYELEIDIGFTYSFGSLFNNVVNPRFGR